MTEDDLLKKWLNDNLTDAEKKAFSKREDYILNQKIIDSAVHFKASEFSKVDDFETFKATKDKDKTSVKRLNWFKPMLRIASILVIGLAVYLTLFKNGSVVEERTLIAEKTSINLPDLTKVTLNADSKITYDKDTWFENRQVKLKGEAYFKVEKGNTFDVITDNGLVTVVGTEFNVKSRNTYFEVVCYEGIVKVTSNSITRRLLAGDTYSIINSKFSQDKTHETEPEWIDSRSSFKAIPITEVFDELQRQYEIKIRLEDVDVSRKFTGGFTHNNLENALFSITQPMDLMFVISSPNEVLIHDKTD